MKLTWMGTNSLIIETAEDRIGIDPYVQLRGAENPNSPDDFRDIETFLITHGHFDHLMSVPELLQDRENEHTVFCTQTPAGTLDKYCADTDMVVRIEPGMQFSLGNIGVKVMQGKHIHFDARLIARTFLSPRVLRFGLNLPLVLWAFTHYPENGETLVYELTAEGKRIQILGSLGLHEEETYEPGADLLVMPYQGSSYLEQTADRILQVLQPKRVLLTHFDDAFPPLSGTVDLTGLRELMREKYPQIKVVRPKSGKSISLQ